MAKEKKDVKKKRPTALKRDIQNEKRRLQNKIFKSKVRTSVRRFEDALVKGEEAQITEALNTVFSMMDKGVKRGTYKLNKAGRTKSRLTARARAKA